MHNITHKFEINEQKYALDYLNLIYSLLDDDTDRALDLLLTNIENNGTSLDFVPDPLRVLAKSGYFVSNIPDKKFEMPSYDTLNISFAPVHDCNFACKYCYAHGGKGTKAYQLSFDKPKIDKLLRYIYEDKYPYFPNYKFDFVSGGEPLLAFPILEYFLQKMRRMDGKYSKQTTVLIVTNGTLLTREIIHKLDQYDVFLGISVDGPEAVHNRHRTYRGGGDTYKDVVNGIELLHSADVSSKLKDAWAMAVITRDTGSLIDVMETCVSLDFKRMQMQLLRVPRSHPLGFRESDIPQLKEHYIALFDHIVQYVRRGDLSRLKMIANDNDSFGKFIRRLLLREPVFYRCFAGKNKIAVTASGEIYPCDSFCGNKEFCMASLDCSQQDSHIEQLFQQAYVQNRPSCAKCFARYLCGGDCYHNSNMINGDIREPDPIICEINRFFIEEAIALLLEIYQIDPQHISYMARFLQRR